VRAYAKLENVGLSVEMGLWQLWFGELAVDLHQPMELNGEAEQPSLDLSQPALSLLRGGNPLSETLYRRQSGGIRLLSGNHHLVCPT
jgi:hypothetical protein